MDNLNSSYRINGRSDGVFVDGLISSGLTVIAVPNHFVGAMVARDLSTALSSGDNFLGAKTKQNHVLYEMGSGLPNGAKNLVKCFDGKPERAEFVGNLLVCTFDRRHINEGFSARYNTTSYDAYVLDMSYEDKHPTATQLSKLQTFAIKNDTAIIVILASGKKTDFDSFSGSSPIAGICDCWIGFTQTWDRGLWKIDSVSRDFSVKTIYAAYNLESGVWEVL